MATKQRGIMGKRKRQAGIAKPVRFANGTGPGTIGDAPQLQTIDPNSTQVEYAAPTQMSLKDAQAAMRGLYGEGQDYSGELEQLQQLQGNIRGNTFADRLADFGARLASSKSGLAGAYGEALGGSLKDGQLANQQALQNTTALMAARQRIQQAQQARQDAMAGNSVNYAQQQNQDAVNAAKAQYQANVHNVDARTGAIMHNNQTDISQQEIEQRRLAMMSSEPEVAAMKQDALTKAAVETDPAKKADLLAKASQADQALQQIQALRAADLDQKNKATMAIEDHQFGHQKTLEQMRIAGQQAMMNQLSNTNKGLSASSTPSELTSDAVGRNAVDAMMTGVIQKPGGKAGADVFNATQQRMAVLANKYGVTPDQQAQVRAAYKANVGALVPLQKQTAVMDAFEGTAGKNLDLFTNLSKGLVQGGSPLLNTPLRSIDRSALGKPEQLIVDEARTVALNEIAKITSSANAGSGVLSDAARTEAQKFIPSNATLGATIALANMLKQDMKNRHDSYHGILQELHNNIYSAGGPGMMKLMQDINPDYRAQSAYTAAPDVMTVDGSGKAVVGGGNTPAASAPPSGHVTVQGPDGQTYYLPQANLQKALARGYKQVGK